MGTSSMFGDGNETRYRSATRVFPSAPREKHTAAHPAAHWDTAEYTGILTAARVVRDWQRRCLRSADDRLTMSPEVMKGVPVIRGTRVPAYVILDCLAEGKTPESVVALFPSLQPADVHAVLAYAAELAGG